MPTYIFDHDSFEFVKIAFHLRNLISIPAVVSLSRKEKRYMSHPYGASCYQLFTIPMYSAKNRLIQHIVRQGII